MDSDWIQPLSLARLTGSEQFKGLDGTVRDFWAFAMSDLRANNVRGYLAEYLVARAVGADGQRIEWDPYDVLTPEGVTVEVKSTGRMQTWPQRAPSRVSFSGLRGRRLLAENSYALEPTYNAQVYVFAIQTAISHEDYDPLDVSQWEFHVVSAHAIAATGRDSIGLSLLERLSGGPVDYAVLGASIRAAA